MDLFSLPIGFNITVHILGKEASQFEAHIVSIGRSIFTSWCIITYLEGGSKPSIN